MASRITLWADRKSPWPSEVSATVYPRRKKSSSPSHHPTLVFHLSHLFQAYPVRVIRYNSHCPECTLHIHILWISTYRLPFGSCPACGSFGTNFTLVKDKIINKENCIFYTTFLDKCWSVVKAEVKQKLLLKSLKWILNICGEQFGWKWAEHAYW